MELFRVKNLGSFLDNGEKLLKKGVLSDVVEGYPVFGVDIEHLSEEIFGLLGAVLEQFLFGVFDGLAVAEVFGEFDEFCFFSFDFEVRVDL